MKNEIPKNRTMCVDADRPCRHWHCRYHLNPGTDFEIKVRGKWLPADVQSGTGDFVALNGKKYPLLTTPSQLRPTCALDWAEENGEVCNLAIIADLLHISRERCRQVLYRSLDKAEYQARLHGLDEEDVQRG